jgi:hypothetical protein
MKSDKHQARGVHRLVVPKQTDVHLVMTDAPGSERPPVILTTRVGDSPAHRCLHHRHQHHLVAGVEFGSNIVTLATVVDTTTIATSSAGTAPRMSP